MAINAAAHDKITKYEIMIAKTESCQREKRCKNNLLFETTGLK